MITLKITDFEAIQFLAWKERMEDTILFEKKPSLIRSSSHGILMLNKIKDQIKDQILGDHTVFTAQNTHIDALSEIEKEYFRKTA